eukprot:scaffold10147_cov121-Skeletonema_dohrnii-CCMP3373.AAC.5
MTRRSVLQWSWCGYNDRISHQHVPVGRCCGAEGPGLRGALTPMDPSNLVRFEGTVYFFLWELRKGL